MWTHFFGNMVNRQNLLQVPLHNGNPFFEEFGGIQTNAVRLDFSKLDGEDPKGWLYKANQLLLLSSNQTPSLYPFLPYGKEGLNLVSRFGVCRRIFELGRFFYCLAYSFWTILLRGPYESIDQVIANHYCESIQM